MIPLVGFLPPTTRACAGTVEAIERELDRRRASCSATGPTAPAVDGLPGRRGRLPACTFWLADCLALHRARPTRPASCSSGCSALRNDVGLLSEEYDPVAGRLVGNFPQAFSHVGLVNTAHNLAGSGAIHHRTTHDQEQLGGF